jgi:hypothetical protein
MLHRTDELSGLMGLTLIIRTGQIIKGRQQLIKDPCLKDRMAGIIYNSQPRLRAPAAR